MKILISMSDYDDYCKRLDQVIAMLDVLQELKCSDSKKNLHQVGISALRTIVLQLAEIFKTLPESHHDSIIEFSDGENYKHALTQLESGTNIFLLVLHNFENMPEFFNGLRTISTKLLFLRMELRLQELDALYRTGLEDLKIKQEQYRCEDT